MTASLPRFADRVVRDAARGEWRDGEARYLLLRHDSLMGLFRRLPAPARASALAAFAVAVADAGGRSAARYRQTTPDNAAALLDVFATTAADLGWGAWSFASPGDAELRLAVANSPFAAGFGPSAAPVCAAIAGMLGSIAAIVLGRPAAAEETCCAATGADTCRFVARAVTF